MNSNIICGVPTVNFDGAIIISKCDKREINGNANKFNLYNYTFISTYNTNFLTKIKLTFKMVYKLWMQ